MHHDARFTNSNQIPIKMLTASLDDNLTRSLVRRAIPSRGVQENRAGFRIDDRGRHFLR